MYPIENSGDLIKNKQKQLLPREMWMGVGSNVIFLGLTSLLTDISSEMVTVDSPVVFVVDAAPRASAIWANGKPTSRPDRLLSSFGFNYTL